MIPKWATILLLACLAPSLGGCFLFRKPDKANIELRKENQELQEKIAELQRQSQGDRAMLRSLQERVGTLPTLPRERLERLFTTHDLRLGRLTGGADLDPSKPGHDGLRVFVTPLDQNGDPIKAAGSFTVEAFDLARGEGAKIGTWKFDLESARQAWMSVLNRYEYVLVCPWQTPPSGNRLHIEVTFTDELTQGKFEKSADVTIEPPGNARPATAPGS